MIGYLRLAPYVIAGLALLAAEQAQDDEQARDERAIADNLDV